MANDDELYKSANLDCRGTTLRSEEQKRRARNVWNCAVERRLYDQFYTRVMSIDEQDRGHRWEKLKVTQHLFETCYPLSEML